MQQLSFLVCCICRIEFICTDSNLVLSPSSRAEKDQISYLQIPILSRPLLPGQPAQVLAQSRPHSIHFPIHPYSCPTLSPISLTHYDDDDDVDVDVDVDDDNDNDNDDDLPFHPHVSCELQVFPNHKELTNMLACLSKCFLMLHFTPFTHLVGRSEEF